MSGENEELAPSSGEVESPADSTAAREDVSTSGRSDATQEATVLRTRVKTVVSWEAPLPPPALLEQYDQIVPGLASDIAKQARIEADHVRTLDTAGLKAAVGYHTRGQWMGFGAVLGILGVSALAIVKGATWVAGIALTITVTTAAVFVVGALRKSDKENPRGENSDPQSPR